MPLLFQKNNGLDTEVGVWNIKEDESYFLDNLRLHPAEQAELGRIKGRKRVEWLAVRHLLHIMSGRSIRAICLKDEFGKPYLQDSSAYISMSHSNQMAAVIAGQVPVGIDVQYRVDRIDRIAHKFIGPQELDLFPQWQVPQMHLIWGAKECLYKAYGRKKLDFRSHIIIESIASQGHEGNMTGIIQKDGNSWQYQLHYEWLKGDICLVTAIQLSDPIDLESYGSH